VSELVVFIFYFSKIGKSSWKIPVAQKKDKGKKQAKF